MKGHWKQVSYQKIGQQQELTLFSKKCDIELGLLVFQLYRHVNAMPYTEFTSTVISSYPNEDVLDGYIVIVSDFESGSFPPESLRP